MKDKLFKIAYDMESLAIEIKRIENLVSILLEEHFDSKAKLENEHGVTYWVPYDDNFQTLTEVINQMLSEQQKKSKELFEQFWELKDKLTEVIPPKKMMILLFPLEWKVSKCIVR